MPAAKFRPVAPEHDDGASGHVLAAVVADTLDDGHRTGVADAEALTGDTADEGFTGGRAVERDVADDDVVLGAARRSAPAAAMTSRPPESPLPT